MKYILIFIAGGATIIGALFGWNYYTKNIRDAELYQSLGEGLSKSLLRDTVLKIESYKLIFGFYPQLIEELRGGTIQFDPASGDCECSTDYHYQSVSEDSYYLFSKGRDCIAFTEDDIHPDVSAKEKENIGLRKPNTSIAFNKTEKCN